MDDDGSILVCLGACFVLIVAILSIHFVVLNKEIDKLEKSIIEKIEKIQEIE